MSDHLVAVIRSWAQANQTVQQDSGPDYLRMNKLAALRLLSGSTPRPTCIAEASSVNAQSPVPSHLRVALQGTDKARAGGALQRSTPNQAEEGHCCCAPKSAAAI